MKDEIHNNTPHHHYHTDEVDLAQVFQVLKQYKIWAIIIALLCVFSAYMYTKLASPVYRSDALLQFEEKNNPLRLFDDLPISPGFSSSTSSEADIITSRRILGAVVDDLKLDILIQKEQSLIERIVSVLSGEYIRPTWMPGGVAYRSQMIQLAFLELPMSGNFSRVGLEVLPDNQFSLYDGVGSTILTGRVGEISQVGKYKIFIEKLSFPTGTKLSLTKMSRTAAIGSLKGRLDVNIDSRSSSDMIRLTLESGSPVYASDVLNTIVKHYVKYNIASYAEVTERTLNFVEEQLVKFSSDVSFNNDLYLMLLTKAHELRVMKAGEIGNVRVVDNALRPLRPVAPRKNLILAASLIMGIVLGVLVAVLRSVLDRSIYDPNLVEANMNIPVYATIPFSQEQVKLNKQGWKISSNGNMSKGLLFRESPSDTALEAMRFLRTIIEDESLRNGKHRVIAITGPSSDVGKTFLATNLACLLSELNMRVLLVDADLRRGVVHEYFALEKECGLAEYLTESVKFESIAKYSGIDNMDVVTSGGTPDNPSVLMSSSRLKRLLEESRDMYDIVVIDTPPVLSVTDAAIISRYVDQLLLVIRAGMTTMDEVTTCWSRLTQSGNHPSGLVMSGYDPAKLGYGKNYQYGYY